MFYGWFIVAASALIDVFVGGTTMRGLTALVNPLAATMGWSYAQISLVMTLRGIETGVLNPFIGVVVDRWPARRLVFIGIVIIGLGVLCFSQVNKAASHNWWKFNLAISYTLLPSQSIPLSNQYFF